MLRTRALPHRPAPQRARSYTTSINVGQRPVINVATVHSKITSNDLALLQALQAKFTFQDPKFKFLKKFRAGNLHWVHSTVWRGPLTERLTRMGAWSF